MEQLGSLGVGIAVLTITLIVAFLVMANTKTQLRNTSGLEVANVGDTNGSAAWNSTSTLQNAAQTLPGWVPLIVLVAIGAVILGMIAMFGRR